MGIRVTSELLTWINTLDERTRAQVVDVIDRLAEAGPTLGRPLVDSIAHSEIGNLKELRPGSAGRSEVRILFAFDPWRSAILLTGGEAETVTPAPSGLTLALSGAPLLSVGCWFWRRQRQT